MTFGVRVEPCHAANCSREQREVQGAVVKACAAENEDEGQQVQRERHDPQQWNRRKIGAELYRRGSQQGRGSRREDDPQQHLQRSGRHAGRARLERFGAQE
jgi:hypothetical protein